jgi:uncharacterized protein (DUF2147 family)
MKYIGHILLLIFSVETYCQQSLDQNLVGTWKCTTYDVTVQTYFKDNKLCGNLITFPCNHKVKKMLYDHFDIENPDKLLRTRRLLNLPILWNLQFSEQNKWKEGKVYMPSFGKTISANLEIISLNQISIHGYLGIPFFGKSLIFNKLL